MARSYRLGRRQAAVDQTARSILTAARALVSEKPSSAMTVAAIARRAGVSRITVYNRFTSREGVLQALAPSPVRSVPRQDDAREALRGYLEDSCSRWAGNAGLYRHLASATDDAATAQAGELAQGLAAADALRPGCSLREAEDVINALSSFPVFDRLHKDGRRSPGAVAEILIRMASGILA